MHVLSIYSEFMFTQFLLNNDPKPVAKQQHFPYIQGATIKLMIKKMQRQLQSLVAWYLVTIPCQQRKQHHICRQHVEDCKRWKPAFLSNGQSPWLRVYAHRSALPIDKRGSKQGCCRWRGQACHIPSRASKGLYEGQNEPEGVIANRVKSPKVETLSKRQNIRAKFYKGWTIILIPLG